MGDGGSMPLVQGTGGLFNWINDNYCDPATGAETRWQALQVVRLIYCNLQSPASWSGGGGIGPLLPAAKYAFTSVRPGWVNYGASGVAQFGAAPALYDFVSCGEWLAWYLGRPMPTAPPPVLNPSDHMRDDWFGTNLWWLPVPPYSGSIIQQTMLRGTMEALEASLGLRGVRPNAAGDYDWTGWDWPLGIPAPANPQGFAATLGTPLPAGYPADRQRPLIMQWICALPRFEVQVRWQHGVVLMTVLTPGVLGVSMYNPVQCNLALGNPASIASMQASRAALQPGVIDVFPQLPAFGPWQSAIVNVPATEGGLGNC